MAETKRNSTAGKVATPKVAPQTAMQELDTTLAKSLGARYVHFLLIYWLARLGIGWIACDLAEQVELQSKDYNY